MLSVPPKWGISAMFNVTYLVLHKPISPSHDLTFPQSSTESEFTSSTPPSLSFKWNECIEDILDDVVIVTRVQIVPKFLVHWQG